VYISKCVEGISPYMLCIYYSIRTAAVGLLSAPAAPGATQWLVINKMLASDFLCSIVG